MNNNKTIIHAHSLFISFLVIAPSFLTFYKSGGTEILYYFSLLKHFGFWIYLLWLFAVFVKGKEILTLRGQMHKSIKFLPIIILFTVFGDAFLVYAEQTSPYFFRLGPARFTESNFSIFSLIWNLVYLYLTYQIASIINQVENKNQRPFKTWVLLIFSWIGILTTHKRVKESFGQISEETVASEENKI